MSILGFWEGQSAVLRRIYEAEFDKDPAGRAADPRVVSSNLIALKHSISKIYGKSIGVDVANALAFASAGNDQ